MIDRELLLEKMKTSPYKPMQGTIIEARMMTEKEKFFRIELEGKIITKSPEQADGAVFLRIEEINHGAQHREDGGNARTFFFSENAVLLLDG